MTGRRHYQGQTLGPYYRLVFREAGRQRSLYIGTSRRLAAKVRHELARTREPDRARKADRLLRAGLQQAKRSWGAELRALGLRLQGYEVRGWQQGRQRRNDG